MSTNRKLWFWAGLLLYVLSFFLVAVRGADLVRNMEGYFCAYFAVVGPVDDFLYPPSSMTKFDALSILASGLINPLFLLALAFSAIKRLRRAFNTLKIIILLMHPFCWIVFYKEQLYPREGYFLWVAGMMLALLSPKAEQPQTLIPSGPRIFCI